MNCFCKNRANCLRSEIALFLLHRQRKMEGCTLTRYRLDPDTAAAFFHDPLDYGQTRSGAPTTTFIRRVKKVESFFTDLSYHTHPVIRQEERPVVGGVSINGITDPDLDVGRFALNPGMILIPL